MPILWMAVLLMALLLAVPGCLFAYLAWEYHRSEYRAQTGACYLALFFDKGRMGEYQVYRCLRRIPPPRRFLFNLYVPKEHGETTEVDVVMVHPTGLYVFESKQYAGWIFGRETDRYWTQCLPAGRGSHKERFFNPILQNAGHVRWLRELLGEGAPPLRSFIVFSAHCVLKDVTLTGGAHTVLTRDRLPAAVREAVGRAGRCLSAEAVERIFRSLEPLTQVSEATKAAHVEAIHARLASGGPSRAVARETSPHPPASSVPEVSCPRCGAPLALRVVTKGAHAGERFWGCSAFPKCRFRKTVDP